MKKIFTCLATAAIAACTFSAQAEPVVIVPTLYVSSWIDCDSFTSEITENRDGSYTIADFMGVGYPLTFTIDQKQDSKYRLTIPDATSITVDGTEGRYLRNSDEDLWTFKLTADGTTYTCTNNRYLRGRDKYSYFQIYSDTEAQEMGYKYHGYIYMRDKVDGGTTESYLDVDFYFGEVEISTTPDPEPEPSDAVEVGRTTVTANFQTWTSANGYADFFAPFEMELVKYSDGSYSIPNFINSGNDFKFSFEQPAAGADSGIKLLSNSENVGTVWEWGDDWSGWDALLNPDGSEYYEISGKNAAGTEVYVYDIAIDQEADYSYVWRYDMTDTSNKYEYYFKACFFGYDEAENFDYYYLSFFFNDPAAGAGVAEINAADNNAPVEYYNLNGVRVNNPSNGIFIRKQGSKVSKVIVK